MVALMAFAAVVSVAQLGLLGSWSRSVRVTTLFQVVIVGAMVCAPVAVVVEWVATRSLALALSRPVADVVAAAASTYDPVIEEIVKVAPLLLVALLWPKVHRQLGWTDHLLAGWALGTGFGLCETALRFGTLKAQVAATHGGWIVQHGAWQDTVVPSVWHSLTTWQPAPAGYVGWISIGSDSVGHAVWTGLAALGVAWGFRRTGWQRLAGAVPLVVAALGHAVYNAQADFRPFANTWVGHAASGICDAVGAHAGLVLLVLVVADRVVLARAAPRQPGVLLPGEPAHLLNPALMWRAGMIAAPWSTLVAWHVSLERRAGLYGLAGGLTSDSTGAAAARVHQLGVVDAAGWRAATRGLVSLNWRGLLSWRLVLWLIAATPGLVYLVVGGFPATRGVQHAMTGPVGTGFLLAGLLAGVVLVCMQAPILMRALRTGSTWHEARLRPAAALAVGAVSVLASVGLVVRLLVAGSPADQIVNNYHLLDAISAATIGLGIALMIMAVIADPPALALIGLLGSEEALTLVVSEAIATQLAQGFVIALSGILLSQATGSSFRTRGHDPQGTPVSRSQMLGGNSADVVSKATGEGRLRGGKYYRVDVENPNPGQRPGQIHIHVGSNAKTATKYMYDVETGRFSGGISETMQRELLTDDGVVSALNKALDWFGLPPR